MPKSYPPIVFGPPTISDFEMLENAMDELAGQPDSLCVAKSSITRYNMRPRLQVTEDIFGKESGVLFSASGTLRVIEAVKRLDIIYIEAVDGCIEELKREYMLERRGDAVSNTDFSVYVSPCINKPMSASSFEKMEQYEAARQVFTGFAGKHLVLTSGDCAMLHEELCVLQNL